MARVYYHVDDIGLTPSITKNISRCFDIVNSVSVIVNGWDIGGAYRAISKKPDMRVVLHLNFMEGHSLSGVSILTNEQGIFHREFMALWALGITSGFRYKALQQAIYTETVAQIDMFEKTFGYTPQYVDSHQHLHMIPFVCRGVCQALHARTIKNIRVPVDKGFMVTTGANVCKWALLKGLAWYTKSILQHYTIQKSCDFLGVLPTGTGNSYVYKKLLAQYKGDVEILFHTGRATPDEGRYWSMRPRLRSYYLSDMRDVERQALQGVYEQYAKK